MKKIMVIFLALCLCVGLCACASVEKYEKNLKDEYEIDELDDDDLERYLYLLDGYVDVDDYDVESAMQATHEEDGTSVVIIECETGAKAKKLAEDALDIVESLELLYDSEYSFELATQGRCVLIGEKSAVNDALNKKSASGFDEVLWIYALVGLVALALHVALCISFANIAADKGYPMGVSFAMCFFLGMIGCVWIAAKPDLIVKDEVRQLLYEVKKSTSKKPVYGSMNKDAYHVDYVPVKRNYTPVDEENWICESCGAKNSGNYGQCKNCGGFRGQAEQQENKPMQ